MTQLNARMRKLEVAAHQLSAGRARTSEEARRDQEALATQHGMTWDEMIEKHGSFPTFCYWFITSIPELVGPELPTKYDGMTPEEAYRAMINE